MEPPLFKVSYCDLQEKNLLAIVFSEIPAKKNAAVGTRSCLYTVLPKL